MRIPNEITDKAVLDLVASTAQIVDGKHRAHVEPEHTLGVLTEEYHEYLFAVHSGTASAQFGELIDIMVTCLRGCRLLGDAK